MEGPDAALAPFRLEQSCGRLGGYHKESQVGFEEVFADDVVVGDVDVACYSGPVVRPSARRSSG